MPHVEQELLTRPEHMSSTTVFIGPVMLILYKFLCLFAINVVPLWNLVFNFAATRLYYFIDLQFSITFYLFTVNYYFARYPSLYTIPQYNVRVTTETTSTSQCNVRGTQTTYQCYVGVLIQTRSHDELIFQCNIRVTTELYLKVNVKLTSKAVF